MLPTSRYASSLGETGCEYNRAVIGFGSGGRTARASARRSILTLVWANPHESSPRAWVLDFDFNFCFGVMGVHVVVEDTDEFLDDFVTAQSR